MITEDFTFDAQMRIGVPRDLMVTTRDGTSLSVREFGRSDANTTVVLLHGFCLDKGAWKIQTNQLTSLYGDSIRILSYDHRGHGDSETASAKTYSVDQLARDLADVLAVMRVGGHVVLAGHSMGGMTAMTYMGMPADQRPVDPKALVLVATASGNLREYGIGVLLSGVPTSMLSLVADRLPEKMMTPAVQALTAPLSRLLIRCFAYADYPGASLEVISSDSVNLTPLRTKAGFLRALKSFDSRAALPGITAKTTVISGEHDWLTPPEHAREIAASIPDSTHLHCDSAGHMLLHEAAELVTTVLLKAVDESRSEIPAELTL